MPHDAQGLVTEGNTASSLLAKNTCAGSHEPPRKKSDHS